MFSRITSYRMLYLSDNDKIVQSGNVNKELEAPNFHYFTTVHPTNDIQKKLNLIKKLMLSATSQQTLQFTTIICVVSSISPSINMNNNSVQLFAYKMYVPSSFYSLVPQSNQLEESEAWHLSVYAFDLEYSYGLGGITISETEQKPAEAKLMGFTNITSKEFNNYVQSLKGWTANTYDVLNHNCQHFAQLIVKYLGVEETIPSYYTNLVTALQKILGKLRYVPARLAKLSGSYKYYQLGFSNSSS